FSESFARSVEIAGVVRWLEQQEDSAGLASWRRQERYRQQLQQLADETREKLARLYARPLPAQSMAAQKQVVLETFSEQATKLARKLNLRPARWLSPEQVNNAALALFSTYQEHVPAFLALLRSLDGDFAAFFRKVRTIASLPADKRAETMAYWNKVAQREGQVADLYAPEPRHR
ncbi:MAG: hypothetical protein D6794_00640, partial [Deltaproteobacteria bacterium]